MILDISLSVRPSAHSSRAFFICASFSSLGVDFRRFFRCVSRISKTRVTDSPNISAMVSAALFSSIRKRYISASRSSSSISRYLAPGILSFGFRKQQNFPFGYVEFNDLQNPSSVLAKHFLGSLQRGND
jgi:hypothetical protein